MDVNPPRVDYFNDDGYVQTDAASGITRDRAGTRLVALPADFLTAVRQAADAEGGSAADQILQMAGRDWGRGMARRLSAELAEFRGQPLAGTPVPQFQVDLQSAFRRLGWGVLSLDFSGYRTGIVTAEVRHAPADGHALLAGALAGLLSHFAGRELAAAVTGTDPARFVFVLPERLAQLADAAHGSHDEIVTALESIRA